jgi:murein DD-endopeptidase MepM/ murein hydrolase activator NlpD
VGDDDRGAIALLVVAGGCLLLAAALVPLIAVADLVITRGRAQVAADAAALAAMADVGDRRAAARRLAAANGARVVDCCGEDPTRREVTVAASPASRAVAAVVPAVQARAAAAVVVPTTVPAGVATVTADGAGRGRMWPIRAPLTSGFGMRSHPLTGAARLHAGIDLGAPAGTPIRAAAAGAVAHAGAMGGYGTTVDVRHADGTTTRYAHQSQALVRGGQRVAAGQVIGLVGSTGASTGPHLHFEVRTAAGPIDPHTWLP